VYTVECSLGEYAGDAADGQNREQGSDQIAVITLGQIGSRAQT
jgi:hypothetical protein